MSEQLNAFLDNITVIVETEVEASIAEIVAEGESAGLEFKSSLRWDYAQGIVNTKLEQVVMKSIASFNNAHGGTSLIGVNDNVEIIGLERDYSSLKGGRNEFELHLRNLINRSFGKVFATNNVEFTFLKSDENEICRIEIKKGFNPAYITVTDKNGIKSEKFYVQSGNSSQEIGLREITAHINSRFNGA